jgi:hypothetical protein
MGAALRSDRTAGALREQLLDEVRVKQDGLVGRDVREAARFGLGAKPSRRHAEQAGQWA